MHLKVGRAVNLIKRIDQWAKQCGSKEPVLRGWWPGTVDDAGVVADSKDISLMRGRVSPGEKGPFCHRLERLIHIELADLMIYMPYLDGEYPNNKAPTTGTTAPKKGSSPTVNKKCPDCMHSNIDSGLLLTS